jgi:predicted regulator of Ras-like GTPase activity (Roadblock/LC7/MglB family)
MEISMNAVLLQLNAVPGVLGTMVCDRQGGLVAHKFPPGLDAARLQRAATTLSERTAGLESAIGSIGTIDLHFAGARIVTKSISGGRVLFLCSPSVNLQTLGLSTSGAINRLEQLCGPAAAGGARPAAAAAPTGGALYRLVEEIDAAIIKGGGDRFKLRGKIAMKSGVSLDLIEPDTADDPAVFEKLRAAAAAVLGKSI